MAKDKVKEIEPTEPVQEVQEEEEKKIIPVTVGRIVYYKDPIHGEFQIRPAIVTAMYEDDTIDLAVFTSSNLRFERSVKQGDEPGNWDWMPFQKTQHAKMLAEDSDK